MHIVQLFVVCCNQASLFPLAGSLSEWCMSFHWWLSCLECWKFSKGTWALNIFFEIFQSLSTTSRSGTSSSAATYGKRTPFGSAAHHTHDVVILPQNSPMPSGTNSQSESLGASISDLSSEPASEYSENNLNTPTQSSVNRHGHAGSVASNGKSSHIPKATGNTGGTSTPVGQASSKDSVSPTSSNPNSRLPVPKKSSQQQSSSTLSSSISPATVSGGGSPVKK